MSDEIKDLYERLESTHLKEPMDDQMKLIKQLIKRADALVIVTGAGMGVDSGLGTFRGEKAYKWADGGNMDYIDLCDPTLFDVDSKMAWNFWLDMKRNFEAHKPHQGYHILKELASEKIHGAFIYSTNIDGYWDGIMPADRIVEIHGSTKYLQCLNPTRQRGECYESVWEWKDEIGVIPVCIHCKGPARPCVLMFHDRQYVERRTIQQQNKYEEWIRQIKNSKSETVVIEIGSGTDIMTGRDESSYLTRILGATVIRVNPENNIIGNPHVGISMGALEFLSRLTSKYDNSTISS